MLPINLPDLSVGALDGPSLRCPHCRESLNVAKTLDGVRLSCAKCGTTPAMVELLTLAQTQSLPAPIPLPLM